MQIHLDDEFAKSVGLPGIIIHGLCTMAFTSVAVIENLAADDPTRLRRLAVRFASIALPEQTITTRIWETGELDEEDGLTNSASKAYSFETDSDAGVDGHQGRLGGDCLRRPQPRGAAPRPSDGRRRAPFCSTPRSRA